MSTVIHVTAGWAYGSVVRENRPSPEADAQKGETQKGEMQKGEMQKGETQKGETHNRTHPFAATQETEQTKKESE